MPHKGEKPGCSHGGKCLWVASQGVERNRSRRAPVGFPLLEDRRALARGRGTFFRNSSSASEDDRPPGQAPTATPRALFVGGLEARCVCPVVEGARSVIPGAAAK